MSASAWLVAFFVAQAATPVETASVLQELDAGGPPGPLPQAGTSFEQHLALDAEAYEFLRTARAGKLEPLDKDRERLGRAVRSLAKVGDAAGALELVARTWRIWHGRGELPAGRAAAAAALAAPGANGVSPWRCRVLYADGLLAFRAADRDGSLARNEEALRIARETNDVECECKALTGLARVALRDGNYGRVVTLAEAGRTRARSAKNADLEAGPLHLQAAGVRLQGDYVRARELYLESRELN